MSAALVEACQPTERIRDSNIHRKHSPRYADVPVFANRWNKAESNQRTKLPERQTEDQRKKSKGTEEDLVKTESLSDHLKAAHAIKQDDREMGI